MKPVLPFRRALVTWPPKSSFSPVTPQGCIFTLRHLGWFGISVKKYVGIRLRKSKIIKFKKFLASELLLHISELKLLLVRAKVATTRMLRNSNTNYHLPKNYAETEKSEQECQSSRVLSLSHNQMIPSNKIVGSLNTKNWCGLPKNGRLDCGLLTVTLKLVLIARLHILYLISTRLLLWKKTQSQTSDCIIRIMDDCSVGWNTEIMPLNVM